MNNETSIEDYVPANLIFKMKNNFEGETRTGYNSVMDSKDSKGQNEIGETEVKYYDMDPFHKKYIEKETLGEGGAASVKKCVLRIDNSKEYAVKIMRNYDVEKELTAKAEFEMMESITNHVSIVKPVEFI